MKISIRFEDRTDSRYKFWGLLRNPCYQYPDPKFQELIRSCRKCIHVHTNVQKTSYLLCWLQSDIYRWDELFDWLWLQIHPMVNERGARIQRRSSRGSAHLDTSITNAVRFHFQKVRKKHYVLEFYPTNPLRLARSTLASSAHVQNILRQKVISKQNDIH